MSDAATPKKAAPKVKKVAKPKTHPVFPVMITAAVTDLKDKKGTSGSAIKKYILANYKVEDKTVGKLTKAHLKRMLAAGVLKQSKGTGAAGSFKLADAPKTAKKTAVKKAAKSPKKATKSPKKTVKKTATKAAKPAAKKSVKKSPKKAAKSPAKKPVAKKAAKKPAAKKVAKK